MKNILSLLILFVFLPGTVFSQEIVKITADDIILSEPGFTEFVQEKMPFHKNKLINLLKDRQIKHLLVEFSDFDGFWDSVSTYYTRVRQLQDDIKDFHKESLLIREQIFKEPSLTSPNSIQLILSYKFLKKNIEYSQKSLMTLEEDLLMLFSQLKDSAIVGPDAEVTDLKTFAATKLNALQLLKRNDIDFGGFRDGFLGEFENIENARHLNEKFMGVAIEISGAFHAPTEIGTLLKTVKSRWQNFCDYELYVVDNKKTTVSGILNSIFAVLVLVVIYRVIRITFNRVVSNRGKAYAINTLIRYSLALAASFILLSGFGLDLSKVTLLVSALSVGIGFGLTTIVSNFISGILLLIEGSVKVGDRLKLENGVVVTVEEIGLRRTVLATIDHMDIVVPNIDLISKNVVNLTYMKNPITRNRIAFTVNPAVDFKLLEIVAIQSVIETLGGPDSIVIEPPKLLVSDIQTGYIECEILVYIDNVNNLIPDSIFKKNLLVDFMSNQLDIFLAPVQLLEFVNSENNKFLNDVSNALKNSENSVKSRLSMSVMPGTINP